MTATYSETFPIGTMGRFWRKVDFGRDEDCWEWQGYVNAAGYGEFSLHPNKSSAHKMAYRLVVGDVPSGMLLRHTCDNRRCVNPAHLVPGTIADNARDMTQRGRCAHGSRNANAKLNDSLVKEMREGFSNGESLVALSERFGISKSNVGDVVSGRKWRRAPGPMAGTNPMIGEHNPHAKLTPEKVEAIKRMRASGMKQREIGAFWGVTQSVVSEICSGRAWSHTNKEEN